MAEITDRKPPAWVPTTNSLADIPDDLLGGPPPPAEIRLGANVLLVMDNPPNVGDYIDLSMRFRISHAGVDQKAPDSDIVHMRRAALVVAWPLGKEMPEPKKTDAELEAEAAAEAAKNQPPLFGDDNEPHDPDAEPYTESGLDEFDPQFSHNDGSGR
jgi:hypothetical protein